MTRVHGFKRSASAVVTLAVCAGLLASCSSSGGGSKGSTSSGASSSGSGSSASTSTGDTVDVKNFSFTPASLTVAKGTTVTWKFDDSANHNVTASDKSFKSADMHTGGSYSFTFNSAGTYNYICSIHQYMKGSITVK
jgi:plastocyanin